MNHKIITLLIAFILSVSAGFAQTLELETITASPGTVEVKLDMSGFPTNIAAASINIAIDTQLLTYTGGNMAYNGGNIITNTYNDELKLSWIHNTGTNVNSTFAVLKFNYAGALPTDLVFNQVTTEIANVNGTVIPVITFIDGGVIPATPVGRISLADLEVASVGANLIMPLTANAILPFTDFEQVTAFQFNISYDPAKLFYAGVIDNDLGIRINSSTPGLIRLSWSDIAGKDLSNNFLLSNFKFKYLGGGVASLGFSAGMVNVGNPPVSAAVEFVDGSVRIANGPSEGVLSLPEIYSPANSLVAVPINVVEVEEPVSVISLNLNFDASKLTYVGFTNGQLSSWVVNVNQGNGTIAAYYTNVTAQTINDGSLLSFNFDYTSGEAALAFAPGTAMQTSVDNFLNLELVDGFVNNSMMINALPNNADYGSVTGGGVYDYGTQVSLESICAPGCSFENWTEDGVVVSIEGVYEFIAAAACDLVANFEVNEYEVTLAASPESGGAVEGGGLKAFGSLVTVSATANEGYTFVNWAKGETEVSTDAAYTFTMPAENLDLTANFTANTYSLSLTASPTAGGTLVGAGDKVFGTEVTVTATANDGYTFVRWTKGETEVSTETAYTFSMPAEALALTANFEAIEYALTLVSSPEGAGVHNGSGDYPAGSVVAITAAANPGFQFINWTDGTEVVSGVADFSYTMPIGDATLTANYSPVYSISGKVKYANTTGGVRPINTNGSSTTQVILFESDGTTEITRVNTDINGDYSFEGLAAGDYVVSAETDKPWGGNAAITLVDYAYTKAYVDNGFPLIGLSFNAADINQSKTITLVDYAIIRHYVDTGTKLSPWIAPDWIFQEQEVIISNEDWINFDIKGICSGDVNASYEPTL